jgi:hypothetical protein
MAETYRKAKVEKVIEWLDQMAQQCRDEADLIESESGIMEPTGIARRAQARAYTAVIQHMVKEFVLYE